MISHKKLFYGAVLCALGGFQVAQGQTAPSKITISRMASRFSEPPAGYGPTVTWGWQGPVDTTVINRDLDRVSRLGFRMVTIEGGYHLPHPYLSDGYFKLMRYAVEQAKKRGMRVWIIDEGKYPSGFAGGLISEKRPDLRMQALVRSRTLTVAPGKTVSVREIPGLVSAVAYRPDTSLIVPVSNGTIRWRAPAGGKDWKLLCVSHAFRTSPTRSANNPTGGKDTRNSLIDYLNPAATLQFIRFTHAQYKKYIGSEFGKTVVGFRSDEPAFSYTPWTPQMPKYFREQKGYDVTPYLASFFGPHPTARQRLVKADYWEVFSNLFRDHFFKIISEWCRRNHLEYEDHLDHDGPEDGRTMLSLARSEGDYFRDMRYLHIPGIDVIWHQLWPGEENNFPKLASSAAHVFGRQQVFSESFAAFQPAPNIQQMQWVLHEQLVRGINLFEIMFYPSTTRPGMTLRGFMASDSFPSAMQALSRTSYALSQGIPAARIAVLFPSSSLWLGDTTASHATWLVATQLLNHQLDFDLVDDHVSDTVLRLQQGGFENLSGQSYQAVIVPPVRILQRDLLHRLKLFAHSGGQVYFMGSGPDSIRGRSFLHLSGPEDLSWARRFSGDTLTHAGLNSLPHDVRLNVFCPEVKYLHRTLTDGEEYYFFNAASSRRAATATLYGKGPVQVWNPETGTIVPMGGTYQGRDSVKIPLDLAAGEARIIVIGPLPKANLPAYYRGTPHPRWVDYLPGDSVNRIPPGPFRPDRTSLVTHYQVPEWFKDAKFGIFIHWGLYAIPAHHNEWYARHMYQSGGIAEWHRAHYGPQDSFGYKDFIPLFSARRFDPASWAHLFKEAGARYVVPVAEHHDGFKMYASDLTVWDASDMGPHRDVVGELADAVRKEGMKFGISDHQIENWSFMYPGLSQPTDLFDIKNAGFYGPPQPPGTPETQDFLNQWLAIGEELVDKYHPDLFYFDNGVDSARLDSMKYRFGAYYYNRASEWGKKGIICTKYLAYPDSAGVHEYEKQGRSPKNIRDYYWQTDDVISNFSWGYVSDMRYRSVGSILHELIDNVSKNGSLLLNISPRGDGSIPEAQQKILLSIGRWLSVNGEAIYGTRSWHQFGEGPSADTTVNLGRYQYTGQDFRFTTRGDTLYAIAMGWPGPEALITALGSKMKGKVTQVTLLGDPSLLSFTQNRKGLLIRTPADKPNPYDYVFRITGVQLN